LSDPETGYLKLKNFRVIWVFEVWGKTHVWRLLVRDMSWISNIEENTIDVMVIIIACNNTVIAAAGGAGCLRNVHLFITYD